MIKRRPVKYIDVVEIPIENFMKANVKQINTTRVDCILYTNF